MGIEVIRGDVSHNCRSTLDNDECNAIAESVASGIVDLTV
jgi:hypothetical protein